MMGAVLSILTIATAVAVLPALSVTVPVTLWPAPSPSVVGVGQEATPESASLHVKLTVTSVLFQPLAFAAELGEALIVGSVLSMLMPVTAPNAVFPALSVKLWLPNRPAPSWVNSTVAVSLPSIPERASVALKVAV